MTEADQSTPADDSDARADTASSSDSGSLSEQIRQNRSGMLVDFVFAVVWVALATGIVEVLQGPQWALYLLLAAGIPAYFVFFWSLELARRQAS